VTAITVAAGCAEDIQLRMMQRDVEAVRTEVAALSRNSEAARMFVEQQMAKLAALEAELKAHLKARLERLTQLEAEFRDRLENVAKQKGEGLSTSIRPEPAPSQNLEELGKEVRMTQAYAEHLGNNISELHGRVDELAIRVDQFGRLPKGSQAVESFGEVLLEMKGRIDALHIQMQSFARRLNKLEQQVGSGLFDPLEKKF